MDSKHNPERRRFIRIEKHFMISYCEKNNAEKKHNISQIKNLSLGGMCFIASCPYDHMTPLDLELKTPYMDDTLHLDGVVLQSIEKVKNLIYETHISFEKLSPQAEDILKRTIEHFRENA